MEQYEYDPYGRATVFSKVAGQWTSGGASRYGLPFLWKAVRLDEVTGLLQMRNRYYSVETGRFLTRDPIGVWGDLGNIGNEYGYAWGRPLVVGDALGLQGEIFSPPTPCTTCHGLRPTGFAPPFVRPPARVQTPEEMLEELRSKRDDKLKEIQYYQSMQDGWDCAETVFAGCSLGIGAVGSGCLVYKAFRIFSGPLGVLSFVNAAVAFGCDYMEASARDEAERATAELNDINEQIDAVTEIIIRKGH